MGEPVTVIDPPVPSTNSPEFELSALFLSWYLTFSSELLMVKTGPTPTQTEDGPEKVGVLVGCTPI